MLSAVKMCERWTAAGGRTWANSSDRKAGGVPGQQQGSRSHPARAGSTASDDRCKDGGKGCQDQMHLESHK